MVRQVLKKDGYTQTQADHTLFLKHFTDGRLTVLIVYVDDIVLTGNHEGEVRRTCPRNLRSKTWDT